MTSTLFWKKGGCHLFLIGAGREREPGSGCVFWDGGAAGGVDGAIAGAGRGDCPVRGGIFGDGSARAAQVERLNTEAQKRDLNRR